MHADRGAEEEHNPSHTGNLGGREGSVRLTAERQYGRTAQHWIAGTALASKAHAIVRRRNAAAATTTTRMSHMRSTVTGRGSACEHVVGDGRQGEAGGARCGRRGEHAAALSTVWHPILAYGCMHAVLAACQASRRRRALLMDAPRRADVGSMLSKGFAEGARWQARQPGLHNAAWRTSAVVTRSSLGRLPPLALAPCRLAFAYSHHTARTYCTAVHAMWSPHGLLSVFRVVAQPASRMHCWSTCLRAVKTGSGWQCQANVKGVSRHDAVGASDRLG